MLWLQLEQRLEVGLEVALELLFGGVKGGIGAISSYVLDAEGISSVAMGTNEVLQANLTKEDI
jgi:hypothetical protein